MIQMFITISSINFKLKTNHFLCRFIKLKTNMTIKYLKRAINLVIRAAGLSYEIVGNSILVANQSKINAAKLALRRPRNHRLCRHTAWPAGGVAGGVIPDALQNAVVQCWSGI